MSLRIVLGGRRCQTDTAGVTTLGEACGWDTLQVKKDGAGRFEKSKGVSVLVLETFGRSRS